MSGDGEGEGVGEDREAFSVDPMKTTMEKRTFILNFNLTLISRWTVTNTFGDFLCAVQTL